MRVGILTQYYPPEVGAPQARLAFLAGVLKDRGHDVTVLTAMPNYPEGRVHDGYHGWSRHETVDGVNVWRSYIRPSPKLAVMPRMAAYLSFAASSLVVGLRRLGTVDVLLVESPPLVLGPTAVALARAHRARLVFNVSDLWPESAERLGMLNGKRSLALAYRLEAACYRRAWVVTGQSAEIIDDIRRRFPRVETELFRNGVDTTVFTPNARSETLHAELGDGRKVVALYAGLHGRAQGLNVLLDTAERTVSQADLAIAMVGDGPEKPELVRSLESRQLPNVRMLGSRPRAQMPSVVSSSDIALVPLAMQLPGAVPSKLYEAMGCGVPVVLAAGGEASTIVKDAECGIVVQPGDAAALASALIELARDPDRRRAMGAAGRRAAIEQFDRLRATNSFVAALEARVDAGL